MKIDRRGGAVLIPTVDTYRAIAVGDEDIIGDDDVSASRIDLYAELGAVDKDTIGNEHIAGNRLF